MSQICVMNENSPGMADLPVQGRSCSADDLVDISRKDSTEPKSSASQQETASSQKKSTSVSSPSSSVSPEPSYTTVSSSSAVKFSDSLDHQNFDVKFPEISTTSVQSSLEDSKPPNNSGEDFDLNSAGVSEQRTDFNNYQNKRNSTSRSTNEPEVDTTNTNHELSRSDVTSNLTGGDSFPILSSQKKRSTFDQTSEMSRLFTPRLNMEYSAYTKSKKKSQDNDTTDQDEKTSFFVYYLACFATIGGLLFGYDTGIVSGSMLMIKEYFSLSTMWQEIVVSGTVGAAALFSLFAGFTCDFCGRKVTIMAASVVFVVGAIIMGVSETKEILLVGRIVVGIGIGFASMTVPIYVAETSQPSIRGRLVTLNQLFITIGILISSIVAGAFSKMKKQGWRYMLGLAGVPGIIQFIGFLYLPESPRWLVMKGKDEQAVKVLQKIRGLEDVQEEVKEIKEAIEEDLKQKGFVLGRVFRTQHVRKALFVGCGLQVFQQLCGINTVIYYSATILKMAGFPSEDAIWLVLVPNGINFVTTIVGVALVEKLGRKVLTVFSFLGVVIALVVLAVGFQLSANFSPFVDQNITESNMSNTSLIDGCFEKHYVNCEKCIEDNSCGFCSTDRGEMGSCLRISKTNEDKFSMYGRCQNETLMTSLMFSHGYCPTDYTWMAVLGLALFVMAFAPGLGPMPWTINSEIYPMWARGTCNSLATGCNWICNLLVSLFFLTLTETITKYGAFWLFASICFLGMLFTVTFVPETKNKTLEEVEELFKGERGADNLGYEKEIAPPVLSSNTKL